jgi:hypothetical protein
MKRINIYVTEEHLYEGNPCHAEKCALALAVQDRLKPGYMVTVTLHGIKIWARPNWVKFWDHFSWKQPTLIVLIPLTPRVQKFISQFDAGAPLKPMRFQLQLEDSDVQVFHDRRTK